MPNEKLFIPNSTQTPNVYFDVVMPLLTPEEWVVLSYAIRHILGFQDRIAARTRHMSIKMFHKGYPNEKYGGCGLGRNAIIKALSELKKYRLLIPVGEPTADGQEWRIADDSDNPDIEGLQNRFLARSEDNKKRTQKARFVASETGESMSDESADTDENNEVGLSDAPDDVVCRTNQWWSVPQTDSGLSHKHKDIQPSNTPRKDAHAIVESDKYNPTVGNIIQAWLTGTHAVTDIGAWSPRNVDLAKEMVNAGITPADVTAFLGEPFWVGKSPSLSKLSQQIGAWKAKQVQAQPVTSNTPTAPRPMSPQELARQRMLDELRAQENAEVSHDDCA